MPPPTGKAGEIVVRDKALDPADRSTFRGIEKDVVGAIDGIIESGPLEGFESGPMERWEELASRTDTVLTPGQGLLFSGAETPMDPGYETFDVLRDLLEFETAAEGLDGWDSPQFEGLRNQVEELESVLMDFGPDIVVDAHRAEYFETARRLLQEAYAEIGATGDLSEVTKLNLELALDDCRMAAYRLGQEVYAREAFGPPSAGASAMVAGADVLSGSAFLDFSDMFFQIFQEP